MCACGMYMHNFILNIHIYMPKLFFIKIVTFLSSEDIVKKVKRSHINGRNIAKHISLKEVVYWAYKNVNIIYNTKKTRNTKNTIMQK